MRSVFRLVLVLAVLLPTSASLISAAPAMPDNATGQTVRIGQASIPATLDPVFLRNSDDFNIANQLFAGLTRQDEVTGDIMADLATSWDIAAGGRSITFHLRPGIAWSDGAPITAADVVLGLNNAQMFSIYNYVLNSGLTMNAAIAVDPATVRIDLDQPVAGIAPAVMAFGAFRPVPQHVINNVGSAWADPENIVSSGPYRLVGHAPGVLRLEQNPFYYDSSSLEIDRVEFHSYEDSVDATMSYARGDIDVSNYYNSDLLIGLPSVAADLHSHTTSCTYYYGFTTTKPPLDNPLVRKALIAATDRAGVIAAVGAAGAVPATTLAPAGVFGAVPAGSGVGIDYNPAQAQAWLAQSGVSTPFTVHLAHNTSTGHATIAQKVAEDWETNLGIDVIIEERPWSEYLRWIGTGTPVEDMPHVWRTGWCSDYYDQHNWVHELFNSQIRVNYIRWSNAEFDNITTQAAASSDPAQRQTWYRRAEEILNEEAAGILSLYWYGATRLSKPYLERTYATNAGEQVRNWSFPAASTTVGSTGGELTSYDGSTTASFPAGAFAGDTELALTHLTDVPSVPASLVNAQRAFQLESQDATGNGLALADPFQPFTLTVQYSDWELKSSIEDTIGLFAWADGTWQALPSTVDTASNVVTATARNLGRFAVLANTHTVFIPVVGYSSLRLFQVDGDPGDWAGIPALATDRAGEGSEIGTDIASFSAQLLPDGLYLLIEVHDPDFHRYARVTLTMDVEPGEHVWNGHPADMRMSVEPGWISVLHDGNYAYPNDVQVGRDAAFELFIPSHDIPYAQYLRGMWIDVHVGAQLEDQLAWQATRRVARPLPDQEQIYSLLRPQDDFRLAP